MESTMEYTEEDLTAWFRKNRMLFSMNREHYTDDHIMHLAITGGFLPRMVYERHIAYELELKSITLAARASANLIQRHILLWKERDLAMQWEDLDLYLSEGLDFDQLVRNRDIEKEMEFERSYQEWIAEQQPKLNSMNSSPPPCITSKRENLDPANS